MKWWVESSRLEIVNLVGLGWGILTVRVGYQLTIPADEDNNLGFTLFGMRANQDLPEMLLIMMCFISSEKQCIGSVGKNTKKLVIVREG